MTRIFVYGSLRSGEVNHHRFTGFGDTLIARGTIAGALLKDLGTFPSAVPSANALDRVVGEVYEIPDSLAEVLDRFEREADFEARSVIVVDESGEVPAQIEAVAYFFAHPDRLVGAETVPGGDWATHDHPRLPLGGA